MARIAYFLGQFPVISETFIGEEIRAMEALEHEIFPIALHRPQSDFQPEDAALANRTLYFSAIGEEESRQLIHQHLPGIPRLLPFAKAQTTEPLYPLLVHAAHTANYIRERHCTHIHAHFAWGATTYAIAAAKLLNLPVSFTCHGSDVYARPVDLELKCGAADAVFAVAPALTSDIRKIAPGTLCHTVYCGMDTTRFQPLPDGAEKNGRWLFIGRLIDCKGLNEILDAWVTLSPETRPSLDIVGDGPMRQELMACVLKHGMENHVKFLGSKPSSWIRKNGPCYRAFISAFREGRDGSKDTAPMVLKEAMAMGLPIITTEFMDIPEIVGKECAILCPVSAPAELARAVLRIQGIPLELLGKMGNAGRVRVERYYTLRQQAERITLLLRENSENKAFNTTCKIY